LRLNLNNDFLNDCPEKRAVERRRVPYVARALRAHNIHPFPSLKRPFFSGALNVLSDSVILVVDLMRILFEPGRPDRCSGGLSDLCTSGRHSVCRRCPFSTSGPVRFRGCAVSLLADGVPCGCCLREASRGRVSQSTWPPIRCMEISRAGPYH
jgi:hypothetical protein